jgi:signal transduction histidine kinase
LGLDRSEVDLAEVVREVIERFELELRRANCEVRLEAPTPVRGFWDASRLDQVVSNLLSNALKFGPGQPIEVAVTAHCDRAQLSVTDHGIGIDPARIGTIFDRFVRGVPASHYGGLGLGLYISRQIVWLHGGTISVRSQPGAGATFTVDLPTGR